MEQHPISVFAAPPWRGTVAAVVMHSEQLTADEKQHIAVSTGVPATCFSWLESADNREHWRVECFGPGGPIRCCGHGLLATAYVLHGRVPDVFEQSVRGGVFQPAEQQPLSIRSEGDRLWLGLPRLPCRTQSVPLWALAACSQPPMGAAVAGGDGDYCLLEFSPEVDLSQLRIDEQAVCRATSRAVIATQAVTARQTGRCKNYDFSLRYFAPQYGVSEDPVTGSAHRVAADFWAQRLGRRRFHAHQCSSAGGVVDSRLSKDGQSVEISGRLAEMRAAEAIYIG